MPRLGGSQECVERQSPPRKLLGAQGPGGAAVEEAKLIVQAAMARNGPTLLPGLGELLQQLLAARAAGTLPVQNGSTAAGHGMATSLAGSLPNAYTTGSVAAAAAPRALASPRAEAQRSDRRRKEPAALDAGGSRGPPPPPPPCIPSPPAADMAPSAPLTAMPQLCTASAQPSAAAPQVCALAPPPPPQPQQQQATAPHHAQPASQLHADAKVFTPRSAAAAAAPAADVAGAGSRGDARAHGEGTHEGRFDLCHTARDIETGLRSPPPSPRSPVAAARPLSPVPAQQQGGHAASGAAYAVVLQAAAAAAQTQFSCRSGGCGQMGGCAPSHPTTGSSCGVPLKQDVHCSISMAADALMTEVRCSLTDLIMRDPVTAADGCNYERGAIEAWIAQQLRGGQVPRSPVTCQPLDHLTVCPNRTARMLIASLRAAGLIA